jgi:rRNA pseudouridine-1189 N-methylase Emg1 (Nep1/Mra1 family)
MNTFKDEPYSRILSELGVRSINYSTTPSSQSNFGGTMRKQWMDTTIEVQGDERLVKFINRQITETIARENDPFLMEAWNEYQMRLKLKEI